MSYNINNAVIAGRLVADPEARTIPSENPVSVASYRIAVNRRRGKDGQEQADFITCESFGPQAEFLNKYMKKGAPILIEGWVKTESYDDNAGVRKHSTKVIGKRVSSEKDGNLNWNSVMIAGRLTRDPEMRTSSGTNVAKFSVAVDRNSSKKETDFINCTCFGKMAETAVSYLKKGKGICLRGRLQVSDYVNKDGIRTWQTEIIVEDFRFTHTKATGSGVDAQASGQTPATQAQQAMYTQPQAVMPQAQQVAPTQPQAAMPQVQQAMYTQPQQAVMSQAQQAPAAAPQAQQPVPAQAQVAMPQTQQAMYTQLQAVMPQVQQVMYTQPQAAMPQTQQAMYTQPQAVMPQVQQVAPTQPQAVMPQTQQAPVAVVDDVDAIFAEAGIDGIDEFVNIPDGLDELDELPFN